MGKLFRWIRNRFKRNPAVPRQWNTVVICGNLRAAQNQFSVMAEYHHLDDGFKAFRNILTLWYNGKQNGLSTVYEWSFVVPSMPSTRHRLLGRLIHDYETVGPYGGDAYEEVVREVRQRILATQGAGR